MITGAKNRPDWSWRYSLRSHLIGIVLAGVVVPLAVLSAWTTHRLRLAGEELLRNQLDASLGDIERTIERNWKAQLGDLALLSDNDVVRRGITGPAVRLTSTDEQFLVDAFRVVQPVVDEVVYRDARGNARWRIAPDPGLQPRLEQLAPTDGAPSSRLGSVAVEIPLRGDDGRTTAGTMTVLARAGALLSAPTAFGPADASVDVQDERGTSVLRWGAAGTRADTVGPAREAAAHVTVVRVLSTPPLRLVARAPLDPFVKPFEHDARLAAALFLATLAVTFAVAAWLVVGATRDLRGLAEAADAVSHGQLDYRVEVRSNDEVGRVAAAFNAMTLELQRTLREASQRKALAAVGEFAAELAHEVRNPLTSVRLDLQRLLERSSHDPKMRDPLTRALSAIERLNRTVTGALRVARSGTITPTRLQLASALEPAVQTVAPIFTARQVELNWEAGDATSTWLRGDSDALTQLFANVLINAAEATDSQGRVNVEATKHNGSVIVTITDSGRGMTTEILRQLEEPFHTTTKQGGTGIGLTIARRIASAHGGRIEFASALGKGTTVSITLPREDERGGAVGDQE